MNMVSLRFATALHVLLLLAHAKAFAAARALSSTELAASIGANPVVVRRILADLAKAGVIETRAGATGGAWLARAPAKLRVSEIYAAMDEPPAIGSRPKGNSACPVGDAARPVICGVIRGIDQAVTAELAKLTLAQLLTRLEKQAA